MVSEYGPSGEMGLKKEKHFSKEEIVKKIELIAAADKIESGDLQVESGKEKYDSEGNLVYLPMQVLPERSREKKCGNIWYIYLAKGTHGPVGFCETTRIIKADSTIELPEEVDFATTVLEYNETEDKWA